MSNYIFDFVLFALFLIGISAFMGPIMTGIGYAFSRNQKMNQVNQTTLTQQNWKVIGGRGHKEQ